MRRVSRERLEPYFRLHHDANLNIIRNWVGQSTEEVFYALVDEYGLLSTTLSCSDGRKPLRLHRNFVG